MIVFDKVTKSYPMKGGERLTVLDEFSGTLPTGLNVGILGRNGAGKSTIMRLIAGSDAPTEGVIFRQGRISWPLGFSGGINPKLTGRQNMAFITRLYRADFDQAIDFVEDFAQIGKFMDEPVKNYSSGMRARLSFGISMAIDFDYYLIDEVIGVGDQAFRKRCKEVLEARRATATVLLVSHSSKLLREFCDVGGFLSNGKLSFYDNIEEAIYIHAENQKSISI